MTKQIKLAEAILSLNGSAIFSHNEDDIIWYDGTTPIEIEDIKAEQKRLQDIEDAK
tara:strand:- start:16 stop:183 length:168 start_codon:yes stop_codon:yes gene_type:complete